MPSSFQSDIEQVVRIAIKADPTVPQKLAQELRDVQAAMDVTARLAPVMGMSMTELADDLLKAQQRAGMLQMAISTTRTSFVKDTGAMSRAWIEFARGAEDYSVAGFVGALNNIPGVVYNMGAAFGMAVPQLNALVTAVSLGGTAALILKKNWSSIMDAFGMGHTQTEAEHMKELGKQTEKTAAETEKLLRYKEQQAEIDTLASVKSDEQKARKEAVEKAIGGDKGAVRKGIIETHRDELLRTDKEASEAQEEIDTRRRVLSAYLPADKVEAAAKIDAMTQAAIKRRDEALIKAADKIMADAAVAPTDERLKTLIRMVTDRATSFPKGLADKLAGGTAEGFQEEKDIEAEMKAIQKDVNKRVHDMVRAAHKIVGDVDLKPEEKMANVSVILTDLERSGLVGEDVRQGREQLENVLDSITKEIAAKGKVAAGKQASRATTDLVQSITRAMADKSLGRDEQAKVIQDALAKGKASGLSDDLMERVRDAATTAQEQLNNRAITAEEAAKKKADAAAKRAGAAIVRGTSHEFRQGIADIRARPDMAPQEKGAALVELRRQLEANKGNLTDVVIRDIRQSIDAAYRAAAQQAQRQQVKAAKLGRPTAEIEAAAEPMVQYAVSHGVPAGKARHDVTQNLERLLSQQYNLMQAYMLTEQIMDSYIQTALQQVAELQRRQAMQAGGMRRMGGVGNPSLQQTVRPTN